MAPGISKLQIPGCRECHECHGCRRALPRIAQTHFAAPGLIWWPFRPAEATASTCLPKLAARKEWDNESAMTVRLELKPDVEANLAAQARARGVPLDAYLQSVIEDLARADAAGSASRKEIEAALDSLAEMGRGLPLLPSSAFSRESIYRDHD